MAVLQHPGRGATYPNESVMNGHFAWSKLNAQLANLKCSFTSVPRHDSCHRRSRIGWQNSCPKQPGCHLGGKLLVTDAQAAAVLSPRQGVTREGLAGMLGVQTTACGPARDALIAGGTFIVWEGVVPADRLAHAYRTRLRITRKRGQPTLALAATVDLLFQATEEPLRIGRIDAADTSWTFMLFLNATATAVLSCTGVVRCDLLTEPGTECQRPFVCPGGGQMFHALMADSASPVAARYLPAVLRTRSPQWHHPLPCGGLGEAERFTLRDHDVSVVEEPVDSGGGQGLRHDLVEA